MKRARIVAAFLLAALSSEAAVITVDDDGPADYSAIQPAINAAIDGDVIIVETGLYPEDVNFLGKNITLTGGDPSNWETVEGTVIGPPRGALPLRSLRVNGHEPGNATLVGLTVNGVVSGTYAILRNCVVQGNCCSAVMLSNSTMHNCFVVDNNRPCAVALFWYPPPITLDDCLVENCTITTTTGCFSESTISVAGITVMRNCAIQSDPHAQATISLEGMLDVSYCMVEGGLGAIGGPGTSIWGPGNIDVDPCFVRTGYWEPNDPNWDKDPNNVQWPDWILYPGDYHLKSAGGRYDPNLYRPSDLTDDGLVNLADFAAFGSSWRAVGTQLAADLDKDGNVGITDLEVFSEKFLTDGDKGGWVRDSVTSRCIDAGNPGSSLADEPTMLAVDPDNEWGVNKRVNLGAYGGTTEASIPPHGWVLLADLTNDGVVDFNDFSHQAADYGADSNEMPGDLNREGNIGAEDVKLLTEDWLIQTTWH